MCIRDSKKNCKLRVAPFTFGFDQGMMTGRNARKHYNNFVRICAQLVEESDCDLLFACEVGGFRMGFRHAEIDLWHLLREPFGDRVQFAEIDNYVAVWNFGAWNGHGGAAQPAQVSLHGCAERYTIPMGIHQDVDAAITRFDVVTSDIGMCHVVVGNMHIVCGQSPPSILTRQRAVRLLRDRLDGYVFAPNIPVVRIMVGDNNLDSHQVREALQRETDTDPLWEVYPAPADRQGDHVAVTGAAARFWRIAVGASFRDRGMRNDCHDAVAVVITTRTEHTRSLRHARFIRAILTIVRAWHREQHVF